MSTFTLNVNLFSNIMAQGYNDNNYNNNYGDNMYSKYPTDDKKYECQKGPFEGFFVSSVEFCKRALVVDEEGRERGNGIVGPQGLQGQTGTIGPASTIAGPQGPPGQIGLPGPQGERGLTGTTGNTSPQGEKGLTGTTEMRGPAGADSTMSGPQGERGFNGTNGINGTNGLPGPAGPNQINSSNLYLRPGNLATTPGTFATITSTATCDSGDIVLHGNYNIDNFGGGPFFNLITSTANTSTTFDSYSITVRGEGVRIQSNALCFNNL
jgi:hypothetical protein